MTHHDKIHYGLTGILALIVVALTTHAVNVDTKLRHIGAAMPHQTVGTPKLRIAWEGIGQEKTIALGEAVQKIQGVNKVMIFCPGLDCQSLASDIDDAMQIAGWSSDFERRAVDSESDKGIFVGPKTNPQAQDLKRALEAAGLPVELTNIDGIDGLGIIIGKRY